MLSPGRQSLQANPGLLPPAIEGIVLSKVREIALTCE